MKKAEKMELWSAGIAGEGYFRGYAVIGLKMILVKVKDRALMRSVRRRKELLKEYNFRYYRENKDKMREYHREYMRQWRRKRLHGVTS